jgi:methylmalonyl-CoA mutase
MPEALFSDFPPTPNARWREQAEKELRGKDFAETLRWRLAEGISLDPYFTADDLADVPVAAIQGAQKAAPGWENRVELRVETEREANALAHEALTGGADALTVDLRHLGTPDLPRLLGGLKLADTPVSFRVAGRGPELVRELKAVAPYQLRGSLDDTAHADWEAWAEVFRLTDDSPGFRFATIQNVTPRPVKALTEILTFLTELLDELTNRGLDAGRVLARLEFSRTATPDFLTELALLRALRFLVGKIGEAYGAEPVPIFVHVNTRHAVPPATGPDFEAIIRATTESMAALAGGADALTVGNHAEPDAFSRRIARNVSNLLKHEAHFARVADPAAGSYFLERLTWELARAAWERFLTMPPSFSR